MKSIISVFIICLVNLPLYSFVDVRLISSDTKSAVIQFIPSYDSSTVVINSEKFLRISFFDGYIPEPVVYGSPAIFLKKISVGVPSEFGNTIEVVSAEYKDIPGKISPVAKMKLHNGMPAYSYEINENYGKALNYDLISFSDFGLSRGLPVQMINIAPVQIIPDSRIRLYTKIIIRINFAALKSESITAEDDLLKDGIINYSTARSWIKREAQIKKENRSSVLASGKWYRFEAPEEGIYKINKQMLAMMGIDPAVVDPATIKIYNNGGKELPENLLLPGPEDLQENAIFVAGQSDGKFDAEDYILFYGRGIHFWESDSAGSLKRFYHCYSSKNYYWITSGGTRGKRMQEKPSVINTPENIQTTTKAYTAWEEDKSKLQPDGRLYLGDAFGENSSRIYTTNLDGIIPESTIKYKINFVNHSEGSVSLMVSEGNNQIIKVSIPGLINMEDSFGDRGKAYIGGAAFNGILPDEKSVLKFNLMSSATKYAGYLDWFEIYYDKYLKAYNGELMFYADSSGPTEYHLNGFTSSSINIFDVTDYTNVKIISGGYSAGNDYIFRAYDQKGCKYLTVENSFKTAVNITGMANSNLHGNTEGAKFIIITPKVFKEQAERLKRHKENDIKNKISTVVIDVNDIFNEFSCGMTDVCAIRNFIKYAFENWIVKPEYVLLFGDGDYDYKNIEGVGQNFIIPFESRESYSAYYSFVTDDFYSRISGNDPVADIAIGRLNLISLQDAETVVNKIIKYETQKDFGLWRNLITLVADDHSGDDGNDEGTLHTEQSERLSTTYLPPYFEQAKIYLALYPTVQTGTGIRKPAVDRAIIQAINNGTLILNFTGHGNEEVWTHESVFQKGITIPQLNNDKYFFLSAATCNFARYDIPGYDNQSAAELMITKPESGSIGTFAAARTVESGANSELNNVFFNNLLKRDSSNQIRPIGKSYYITKMTKYQLNDMKFHLFGDPTLRLAVPEIQAKIDSINNKSLTEEIQIKALSPISICGSINSGTQNFNGKALISVYDSERKVRIKEMNNYEVLMQGGLIYRGRVTVEDSKFTAAFTVPKDISYENKNGKISVYVYNNDYDGLGYTKNIIIGGTDSTKNDGKGPEINIGFDNDISQNCYLVKSGFELNVKLEDQTGINITGTGIGHRLEGILNDNENSPIDFTNYFIADLNSGGKSGVIKYKFDGIEVGDYSIQIKAWDVFNNFSMDRRSFTVVNSDDITIRDVYNYPNPFALNTTFTFQHNLTEPVDVKINIYTVAGRKIRVLEQNNIGDKFVRIDWDGRDENRNAIANGIYLYKVVVSSSDGSYKREVLGKLAVIR